MDAIPIAANANIEQYAAQAQDDDARLDVARKHGFASWAIFARHVASLAQNTFEAAADAVVDGELATLQSLLRADPELIRARSDRVHRSTLLHYVAANGVEDFRQRTPANIVAVTRLLLDSGAEVDAPNLDYGGNGTALGLVATSIHPARAGVQIELMEMLVVAGANVEGLPGGWQPLIAALANGQPEAARWLAAHGARWNVVSAAGVGRFDVVQSLADDADAKELQSALKYACEYGHARVAEFLLDRGVDIAANEGQSALHLAAHGAQLAVVQLLLARGAPLEIRNRYGGTVLGQALWSAMHSGIDADYLPIVEALIAAGAKIKPEWSTGIERIDEALRRGERRAP